MGNTSKETDRCCPSGTRMDGTNRIDKWLGARNGRWGQHQPMDKLPDDPTVPPPNCARIRPRANCRRLGGDWRLPVASEPFHRWLSLFSSRCDGGLCVGLLGGERDFARCRNVSQLFLGPASFRLERRGSTELGRTRLLRTYRARREPALHTSAGPGASRKRGKAPRSRGSTN